MSPWAAQMLLWLNSTGKGVQSWLLPSSHRAERGGESRANAPALLPSILCGGTWRRSHRRERAAVRAAGREVKGQVMLLTLPWVKFILVTSCGSKPASCMPGWLSLKWHSLNKTFMQCWRKEHLSQPFFCLFVFYSVFECAPLVLWEWISCNAHPDSIHHSSRFAASSLQQLVFPHSSCSAVCMQATRRRAVPAGGKRLCLSWPGKTAGPGGQQGRRRAAAGALLQY